MEKSIKANGLFLGLQVLLFVFLIAISSGVTGQDKFWGMTNGGGTSGNGVLFSINTDGTGLQVQHNFTNGNDGGSPYGSLVQVNNFFYGVTSSGGDQGSGTIFSFDPSGTGNFTTLYDFADRSKGWSPHGGLVAYPNGKLYGITYVGGANNIGAVFSFDPATGIYTDVYDLQNSGANLDGSNSYGPLLLYNYVLYGITRAGGVKRRGTLFSFDPRTNVFKKLNDFTDSRLGTTGMVVCNHVFYSVTQYGGSNNVGNIFSYNPASGVLTTIYNFDDVNGAYPFGLTVYNNKLYGGTFGDGNGDPYGVLYSFDPSSNQYTKLYSFDGNGNDANGVQGSLIANNGKLTGMATFGGASGAGAIFQYDLAANTLAQVQDFNNTNGSSPDHNGFLSVPGTGGTTAQTITFSGDITKTYGDPDFSIQATASSGLPVTYASSNLNVAWVSDGQIHIMGAGTSTIMASQPGSTVYAAASAKSITLTVNKANLVIKANDTVRHLFQPNPVFTVNYTGFVNGDSINNLSSLPVVTTVAMSSSPVGDYPIIVSGAAADNYSFTYLDGVLTVIGQLQSISFTDTIKNYGDTDFATATASSGLPVSYASSNSTVASITTDDKIHIVGVGTDTITLTQEGDADYAATSLVVTLTVKKANLSMVVDDTTKVYMQNAPVFLATYTGLVNGDTPGSLQTVFSSEGAGVDAYPGIYLINAALGAKALANYTLVNYKAGILTVLPQEGNHQNSLETWFSSQSSLQVNLYAVNSENALVQVFDMGGRQVAAMQVSLRWGYNVYTLPASNLTAGVYIIRVTGDDFRLSKTLKK